jgi:hypothetical protein
MKLWLLQIIGEPWSWASAGFVIAASSEQEARQKASELPGICVENSYWLNPKRTTACKIADNSKYTEPTIVLEGFRAG